MTQLVSGDVVPSIMGKAADGTATDITATLAGSWATVLLYRGDW